MENIKPLKALSLEGNVPENWKVWKQNFEFYLIATESSDKTPKIKAGLFLHSVGDAGRQLYNTLEFANDEEKFSYDTIIAKFEENVTPRKNTTFCRYKFFTYRQEDGQTFDKYLTELRKLSNDCELGIIKDSLLKDMLIIGLHNKRLQERLLRQETLTSDDVIKNCKTAELTTKQARTIQKDGEESQIASVNANLAKNQKTNQNGASNRPPWNNYNKQNTNKDRKFERNNRNSEDRSHKIINCKYCSFSHNRNACPAYHQKCNLCKKKGHYSRCCTSKQKKSVAELHLKKEEDSASTSSSETDRNLFVGVVFADHGDKDLIKFEDQWTIDLCANETIINFKLDTGAQANVLPFNQYLRLTTRPKLMKTKVTLSAYNNTQIPTKGACILNIKHRNKNVPVQFIVADIHSPPIIGLTSCQKLHLIERVKINSVNKRYVRIPDSVNEFSDVFGKLGCFSKPHHIHTNPDVKPTVQPPKNVPIAKESKLYDEVMRMVEMKVAARVEEPTDWVNSYVAVEKPDGTLRLCLDPRDLNKAVKRPHFKLPTAEEILAKITGGKIFTKLDASAAYWQIPVDSESSKLLTFSTPFGRFKFLRLPYGLCSASDVCQQYISDILIGLDGAINSQDDIIIWGADRNELETRTRSVLNAIQKSGMKLNRNKCQFEITELTYLGHKVTSEGIQVDDSKIKAIRHMPYPTSVKELQRFLGSVNYLRKFIPNLSDKTVHLNKLLQKDVKWTFEENHKKEINELKELLTKAPVLKVFDSTHPTRISCDASSTGLGAILEQKDDDDDWYPVAYASRSLKDAEKNYCQLEKEALSILFACTKFHQYVYGRRFYVFNDHKPLKGIFNKPLIKAPARIQRFLLRLQQYDFEMQYLQGSLLYLPDTLSRSSLKDTTPEITEEEMKLFVHSVITTDLISENKMAQLKNETQKDSTLQLLQDTILKGWPEDRKKVPDVLQPYFKDKFELSVFEGVILKDNRIIVPTTLRKEYMKLLHVSHLGIVKTKTLARTSVYWPNINTHIKEMIQGCEACQIYRNQQTQEPEIKHDIPYRPWSKVGTDLFTLNSKYFIIVVDYTTNYFDLEMIPDKKSSTVTTYTKRIFSKFGIPKIIMSDNGPEFVGKSYSKFSKDWDFKHITSSPHYPQGNGQIERTIQTVKKTLKKAINNDEDPYLALLSLRASAGPYNNSSPATAMFNRPIRTVLPSVNSSCDVKINKKLKNEEKDGDYTRSHDLTQLNVNDEVRLFNGKKWSIKGFVIEQLKNPRSYLVQTQIGTKLRRNRRHILLTKKASKVVKNNVSDDDYSDFSFSLIGEPMQDHLNDLDNDIQQMSDDESLISPISSDIDSESNVMQQNDSDNDILVRSMQDMSILDSDIEDSSIEQPMQPLQVVTRSGRQIQVPFRLRDYDTSR